MPSIGHLSVEGRRVLITGAARGIGAALARRLYAAGARVALLGLEPELLAEVARDCGDAPWVYCDVADRDQVDSAVASLVGRLGGLDVVVANAGIARQLALIDGDPEVLERTLRVNVLGSYYTLRAAGPHIAHPGGYVLLTASLAASLHLPLIGAYSASKAAVEALGNTVRQELRHTGAKVGVAFYSELDTDMTSRGFGTKAARSVGAKEMVPVGKLSTAIRRIEDGIAKRSRRIVAPWWVSIILFGRPVSQRVAEVVLRRSVAKAVGIAATEDVPFTTPQPLPVDRSAQTVAVRKPEQPVA